MKACLFIFLLIAQLSVLGQIKNGEYCSTTNYVGECITFKKNYQFAYSSRTCTGMNRGEGHYKIKNDSLFLQFEQSKSLTEHKISHSKSKAKEDSINIRLKIYVDKLPQMFVFVLLTSITDGDTSEIHEPVNTDSNGEVSIKVLKSEKNAFLKCKFVGYSDANMTLELNKNHAIELHLQAQNNIITEKVFTYRISEINKDKIVFEYQWDDDGSVINLEYKKK